jgi:hypothetical protein
MASSIWQVAPDPRSRSGNVVGRRTKCLGPAHRPLFCGFGDAGRSYPRRTGDLPQHDGVEGQGECRRHDGAVASRQCLARAPRSALARRRRLRFVIPDQVLDRRPRRSPGRLIIQWRFASRRAQSRRVQRAMAVCAGCITDLTTCAPIFCPISRPAIVEKR